MKNSTQNTNPVSFEQEQPQSTLENFDDISASASMITPTKNHNKNGKKQSTQNGQKVSDGDGSSFSDMRRKQRFNSPRIVECHICGKKYNEHDQFLSIQIQRGQKGKLKNPETKGQSHGSSFRDPNSRNFATSMDTEITYICSDCVEKMALKLNLFDSERSPLMDEFNYNAEDDVPWNGENTKSSPSGKRSISPKDIKGVLSYKDTSPHKIKEYLDGYIIGQEHAKKVISIAYYNHLKRLAIPAKERGLVKKSNILLAGPTGSGKTLIVQKLASMANVPFAIADATTLTKKGYVGDDVESILLKLLRNANGNVSLAEKGIIYLDECDKLASKEADGVASNYIGGQSVQQSLLKIIEGSKVAVGERYDNAERVYLDTSNILFIFGGAFSGIEKIYDKRVKKKNIIGFNTEQNSVSKKGDEPADNMFQNLINEDFIEYGMVPELVGRLPIIAGLNKLSEEEMVNILTKPKDSICKEYGYLFNMDGIKMQFEKEALLLIAKKAMKKKIGARGLRSVIESAFSTIMFDIPDDKSICRVTITKKFIEENNLDNLLIERSHSSKANVSGNVRKEMNKKGSSSFLRNMRNSKNVEEEGGE